MKATRTIAEGRFLGLYERGDWEFAGRPNATGVVGILAHTANNEVILVEQFRPPMQARIIELTAGLVGDEAHRQDESLEDAARRELLEETGYHATDLQRLYSGPTSSGMTDELTHLFLATELRRVDEGGGVDGEEIRVHLVPRRDLRAWLAECEAKGFLIDFKIHAALWLAGFHDLQ